MSDSPTIAINVRQLLADKGVPEAKHEAKIDDAKKWWFRAGVCAVVSLVFLVAAFYVVYLQRADFGIVLGIALAVPVGLSGLATLFCASQADGEATKAFVQTILTLRGAAK